MQPDDGGGHCEQLRPAENVRGAAPPETTDFVTATLALYTQRLDDYVTAKKHYQTLQTEGLTLDMSKAEWAVAEAAGKLEMFKSDTALLFINALRWAMERQPAMVREIMGTTQTNTRGKQIG
jgi:hypothetical protein